MSEEEYGRAGMFAFSEQLLQYTSEGALLNHHFDLRTHLNLMPYYVVHSCSQNAYVYAVYAFLQPDDFPAFASLYSSSLSSF